MCFKIIKKSYEDELLRKIDELKSNQKSMYMTNGAILKKLIKIINYAKMCCNDYMLDSDSESCSDAFSVCKKILEFAGEDVSKYDKVR